MEFKPWMENITIEDMPNDDLKFVAQCAGIKNSFDLNFLFAGIDSKYSKTRIKKDKRALHYKRI